MIFDLRFSIYGLRRSFRPLASAGLLFLLLLTIGCHNQSDPAKYPNRLIELIVPWAAGGGTDRVARFVANALQRRLGQPVIVVNRTGGSGAVGHSAGALAPPDGYTLTMATFELSTMKAMAISELTWKDFAPVAQLNGDAAALFVRRDAPWKNLSELLDAIRKQPNKVKMSGTATGGAWDLARSGLLLAAAIPPNDVIWVPTQGSAPALVELLGGHIDAVCCSVPEAASQLESGQVRLLAVLGPQRLPDFAQFATAREQGISYDAVGWRGIMLPRGTPPQIVERISEALAAIAASEEFRQFMRKNGFAIEVRGPEAFAEFLQKEELKWREVIKSAGYETLGRNHDPGPRTMPALIAALLMLSIVAEVVRVRRNRKQVVDMPDQTTPATPSSRNPVLLVGALLLYLAVMPRIGFVPSTLIFAAAVMWRLGIRLWLAAAGSVVLVATVYLLFVTLFKVQLP
jgi:tripartite-type tricarboxylate transporter receptor subunit TctC